MLNFDFWDAEWPLIVAAPHIVLGGLAVAILILVVFLIVQLACSRQIAGQKAESVALNRRLRLASDRQDEVTRKLETVTTKVVELAQHIMGKATISVLLDDTAKLSGTIVDLAHANSELATTLTTSRTTAQSTQYTTTWLLSVDSRFGAGRTVARIIGRIFLTLALLAVSGFVLLVLIGLWDRYERETAASGLTGIYVGDLASQADLSYDPKDRAAAEAERTRQGGVGREQLAPAQFFQQVPKLVGTGAAGSTNQGMSVALSADGNTTIVGGPGPNNADRDRSPLLGPAGAAWVFTRSGGVWTQQGDKLVAAGARQGMSVALSADGNTAIVGGFADNGGVGAASVFTRSDGHWTQDKRLVGISAVGQSASSVALSADGSIVTVGGPNDNGGIGAAWVFTRTFDYREPLTPLTPPPLSLTASTPPLPPPNLEE